MLATMQETPVARLARWWGTRHERMARPAGSIPCGSIYCDNLVSPGEGVWNERARSVACSEDCAHVIEADRLY